MKRHSIALWIFMVTGLAGILFPTGIYGAEDAGRGTISGTVRNGTTEGAVSDLELILRSVEEGGVTERQRVISEADGGFAFQDIDLSQGAHYGVYAVYEDVEYYSPLLTFDEEVRELSQDLTVYEPSASDRDISVSMHHVVVEFENNSVSIGEMISLTNSGDTIYVGTQEVQDGKQLTLQVSLPAGATDLQIGKGLNDDYTFGTEDGLIDTMPIPPGEKRIEFFYRLDSARSTLPLTRIVHLSTRSFDLFISTGSGIQAESRDLDNVGLIGEPDAKFLHFSAKQLSSGSRIAFTLHNLPREKTPFNIFALFGILAVGLGVSYPLIRRWTATTTIGQTVHDEDSRKDLAELREERRRQLLAMAELDNRLESGQISSEEHRLKRQTLKQHVVELTKMLQQHNTGGAL